MLFLPRGQEAEGRIAAGLAESILKGGDSGPAVVPGKPDESLMVEAIHYEGLEMPPTGGCRRSRLTSSRDGFTWGTVAVAGSHGDGLRSEPVPIGAHLGSPLWSLQPLRRPPVPDITSGGFGGWSDWCRNPIDRFILNGFLHYGLTPTAEADKATLIRRVTFDLMGLPPSPETIDAFLADERPDAYERLVDRLLASPRYGQRWARHWLDLVRFAESDGYRSDAYRPAAWRYRDYVVRSFNVDRPYDRFLTEQLAGDELDPDDPELASPPAISGWARTNTTSATCPASGPTSSTTSPTSRARSSSAEHRLRPMPRSQVRPDPPEGLLPPPGFLHAAPAARRPADGPVDEVARVSLRLATWEKAASGVLRELDAIAGPHRDPGRASAIAQFPDEIKRVLAKPEAGRTPLDRTHPGLSSVSLRARASPGAAQGFGEDPMDRVKTSSIDSTR